LRGGRRALAARFRLVARAGELLADVRQLDLPGPPLPRALHAATRAAFPLPQSRRQHAQGAVQALASGHRPRLLEEERPHRARRRAAVDRRASLLPAALPRRGVRRLSGRAGGLRNGIAAAQVQQEALVAVAAAPALPAQLPSGTDVRLAARCRTVLLHEQPAAAHL